MGMVKHIGYRGIAIAFVWIAACMVTRTTASTFVLQSVEDLTHAADVIVIGSVGGVDVDRDESGRIRTVAELDVEVDVLDSLQTTQIEIVARGGRIGDDDQRIYGVARYRTDERVLVFLREDSHGVLRTVGMAMGKFRVVDDAELGAAFARELGGGVTLFDPESGRLVEETGPRLLAAGGVLSQLGIADRVSIEDLLDGVDQVGIAGPVYDAFEYSSSRPARWFEPDSGLSVGFKLDGGGAAGIGASQSLAAIRDAFAEWTSVSSSNLTLVDAGALGSPLAFSDCSGDSRIVFDDPFDEISDPSGCSGVLAVGGYCSGFGLKKVVNGTEFRPIALGRVTFNNGFAGCPFWNRCSLAEIATHEIGHALGFGHSPEPDAIMRNHAYFDGRCTRLGDDDRNAVTFVYPSADSGPVPTATFTKTPTPVDTHTNTPTKTRTPTRTLTFTKTRTFTPTNTRTRVPTWTPSNTPTKTRTFTPTKTRTHTPTKTNTFKPTNTRTRVPTWTPSNTPTKTNTFTPTNTRTRVPTWTPSNTPTKTRTFTPTKTRTHTPTKTDTFTPTNTRTRVPTWTPSNTPTKTRTFTPTNTRTRVPTWTPTNTKTWTPTKTPTRTFTKVPPTKTPTRTFTKVPPTKTPTRTFTRTWTPTSTPTRTYTPTWTPTQTSTNTPTHTHSPTATPVPMISLAGSVRYYSNGSAVSGSTLSFADKTVRTDYAGRFELEAPIAADREPSLSAKKMGGFDRSISSLDAAYILQHMVGKRGLSRQQLLACDVTGDGNVTALDAVRVMEIAVGEIDHAPAMKTCGSDWLFVVDDDGGERVLSCGDAYPVGHSRSGLDIDALLLGDCTGNWAPSDLAQTSARQSTRRGPSYRVGRLSVRGSRARLPIYIRGGAPYHSMDIEVDFASTNLHLRDVKARRGRGRAVIQTHVADAADDRSKLGIAVASSAPLNRRRQRQVIVLSFDVDGIVAGDAVKVKSVQVDETPLRRSATRR